MDYAAGKGKVSVVKQHSQSIIRRHYNRRRHRSKLGNAQFIIEIELTKKDKFIKCLRSSAQLSPNLMYTAFVFTCLVIMTGTLIVYYTSPKPTNPKCEFELYPTVGYSSHDSSHPYSVAVGRFNNDLHMDIVVANFGFDNIIVFLGDSNNSFSTQTTYSMGIGSSPRMVAVGDFNNDNGLDTVVANFGINNLIILLGDGDGTFSSRIQIETGSSRPIYVVVDDFNNDQYSDIAFIGYGTNLVGVLLGLGNAVFRRSIEFSTGFDSLPHSIAVGDLNNDGRKDIAVANYGTDNVGLFFGNGEGTFTNESIWTTGINSGPYSIAMADLNNDTHLDTALVYLNVDKVAIFLGFGNGSTGRAQLYSTGENSQPTFITIADFNNDKKPDMTVVNSGSNSVMLLLGYGNGSFANPVAYSTGPRSSPYAVGIGDFNNDQQLDVAIVNHENNNIKIFNSQNTEKLGMAVLFATDNSSSNGISFISTGTDSNPCSLATGDFNGDNRVDIAVINCRSNNLGISLGYGDGEFALQTTYPTGADSKPNGIAVNDLNNDGALDIAICNMDADNIGIFLGNGNGQFSNQKTFSTGLASGPTAIASDDFNSDGRPDIAVVNSKISTVGIFLGYGNGEFSNQTVYSTDSDSTPFSLVLADFNEDNRLDIAVTTNAPNSIVIFLGHGDGRFGNQLVLPVGDAFHPTAIAVADFNNDSRLDVIFSDGEASKFGVYLGSGNGKFPVFRISSIDKDSGSTSIVTGDFNKDGRLDIALNYYRTDEIGIFFGDGSGRVTSVKIYPTGAHSKPYALKVGNFNNDDRLDLAIANMDGNNIAILLGQSDGRFHSITNPSQIFPCLMMVAIGDFNNDGKSDIATVDDYKNIASVILGYGNGSFSSPFVVSTGDGSGPISIAVGDFNNDSRVDLAATNIRGNNIGIFLGHGNGEFEPQVTIDTGNETKPIALAIGDADNDGRLDIFVVNSGTHSVGVFLGYGNGTFSSPTVYEIGYYSLSLGITVADFNNDDRLDFAVVNFYTSDIVLRLGWGNGTFKNQSRISTGIHSDPTSFVSGDFNNDGNIDIAVSNTNEREEHILILLGDGNGYFSNHGKYVTQTNSRICSLVTHDFSNDGLLDIAMISRTAKEIGIIFGYGDGIFSSQTNYLTGSSTNPMSIGVGDFNNDSLPDLAVANYEKSFVSVYLAFIDTNFIDRSTYFTGAAASPAGIVLGDFTNDGQLDIIVGNDGTHDIIMLIHEGNGKFSMKSAFSADSTFYPTSIVTSDFNNDKQLDIAVVNSVMNTLILLYGQDNGTLALSTVLSTEPQSNPQSVAIGDFNRDNRTDIVVANSDTGSVGLFLRIDNGALKKFETLSSRYDSKPHGVAVADFDNDGWLDIAVSNNGNAYIGFFFGQGDGTFSEQNVISLDEGIFPQWIGAGDFNNDKNIDIIVANNVAPTPVIVLLSNGDRSFRIKITDGVSYTEIGAVGDFNEDGLLDVVLGLPFLANIGVLLGSGDGTFPNQTFYKTGSWLSGITANDFNNDGHLDLILVTSGDSQVVIMFGRGDGTFSTKIVCSTADYGIPYSITAGDFNSDGWLDVAIGMNGQKYVGILFGQGNGTFSPFTPHWTNSVSLHQSIIAGDINNDGRLDIIATETNHNRLAVILGHVNGTFFNEMTYSTGDFSYPYALALGDFNKDGRLDVVVANMLSDDAVVFLGYANEDFVSTAVRPISSSSQPVSIAVGDFDHDACLDVVVADRKNNEIVIIRGSGYGTFLDQKTYSTGKDSSPSWIVVDDFNHDHFPDIAVVNSATNNIGILLGYGNGTFSSLLTSSSDQLSLPVSLCVGHFDNDTHLDIAVASTGNNHVCILFGYGNGSFGNAECRTSGYDSRPSTVVSGDVNGDHVTDIVIANKGSSTIEILTKIC